MKRLSIILCAMALAASGTNQTTSPTLDEVFISRRSIRAYDNGLSNAYLILKARAMGFDTLIMGMRNAYELRKLFEIPDNETVLAVIALGYRAQEPGMPVHRPLDEIAIFY